MQHEKKPRIKLSGQQEEVLICIALGKSAKEIAEALGISIHTVNLHLRALKEKTGGRGASGLTRYAISNGYIVCLSHPPGKGEADTMTGLIVRTTRNGRVENVEIEYLTSDEFEVFKKEDGGDGWKYTKALCAWIRQNVRSHKEKK